MRYIRIATRINPQTETKGTRQSPLESKVAGWVAGQHANLYASDRIKSKGQDTKTIFAFYCGKG